MTDEHTWIKTAYDGLASLIEADPLLWDAPSLCEGWQVRHLVAHVTMPVRLTPEQFGAEMAAAGGDFGVLSNTVAARDAALPQPELLGQLRAPGLHAWEPPSGGAVGALIHAVVHAADVTVPLGRPEVAPDEATAVVLDALSADNGSVFGLALAGTRLESTDSPWRWGDGRVIQGNNAELVSLLSGRTLPDGRALPR